MESSREISRLIEIMAALRTPGSGCPWDLEQNFATIAPYTLEEAYEVADAIARGDLTDLREELGDVEVESFFANSLDNPYLDPVNRAALQAVYKPGTLQYRQEVGGETVVFEGLVYVQFDEDRHVQELPEGQAFVRVVLCEDWGWTNPGVLLLLGMTGKGVVWVLKEIYATERKIGWWAQQAATLVSEQDADTDFCDPSEPANIAEMRAHGVNAVPAHNAVIPGITTVGSAFAEDRLFVTPGCVELIGELKSYSWKTRRKGGTQEIRRDEPEKVNDHGCDTLRYGMMGLFMPAETVTEQIVGIEDLVEDWQGERLGAARL